MIFLVIVALLVNMDSIVYFFEIPYQIVDMGGAQTIVSTLNVIHAVVYVISSGISSGRFRADKDPLKLLRILVLCITSIYTVTCFAGAVEWLYVLVGLHGLLVGLFWSAFWRAFYQKQLRWPMKMSTLTISSSICSVVGPFIAGKMYLVCGKYVLLLFAGLLLATLFLEKPLQICTEGKLSGAASPVTQRTERKEKTEKNREFYKIRQEISYAEGMAVILLFWLGILLSGYLEGIFRSAMAIYLLDYGIGSDVWGMLQSVKLLSQTFTLIVIRFIGENRFVFYKTKTKLLLGMGCFLGGTLIMRTTVSVSLMTAGMILLGIGYGIVYFLCMTVGTSLTGFLNQNLNGIAECLTGAGILLGSVTSGRMGGNPYRVFIWLIVAGTVVMSTFFRKNIWVRAEQE